jgi:two-component system phosphate regulon response regulator PhoB
MKNAQVLVIEDELDIRDLISFQLKSEGHSVIAVESADKAISVIERGEKIDLFIIDWMVPGSMNGLDFTKKLKSHKDYQSIPVIMITALTQAENIVSGLDAGADDYITKPFDLNVLQARVRVQLRGALQSPKEANTDVLDFGLLTIDVNKCRVHIESEEVTLTSTEFKILLLLAQKPGHVYTREQFINSIQGENIFVTGRTIDTHIAGLRKKLGPAANIIETIRGIGYRFKDVI